MHYPGFNPLTYSQLNFVRTSQSKFAILVRFAPQKKSRRRTKIANFLYFAAHQNADRQLKG